MRVQVDTTGLGIILMDYLLTKEWVGEADIVEDIKVHQKLVRRALKYLEQVRACCSHCQHTGMPEIWAGLG